MMRLEDVIRGTRSISVRLMTNEAGLGVLQLAAVDSHIVGSSASIDNVLTQTTRHV